MILWLKKLYILVSRTSVYSLVVPCARQHQNQLAVAFIAVFFIHLISILPVLLLGQMVEIIAGHISAAPLMWVYFGCYLIAAILLYGIIPRCERHLS